MMSFYKKYYKTVFDLALIVLTVYLFMLLFSYLYKIATPIFLAFIIFAMIEPLAKWLNRRGMKKSLAAALTTLLFVIFIIAVLVGLGAILVTQTSNLIDKLSTYQGTMQQSIQDNSVIWLDRMDTISPEIVEKAKEYSSTLIGLLSGWASAFLLGLLSWLTSFSSFLVSFVIGIILAYFLSIEIEDWKNTAKNKTPRTFKTAFIFLKENVLAGIGGYLKAQLKMISITFIVILIALLILRVNNALTISLLAAVFDLLPLLGVSTVFVPWIIYLFIVGQTSLAIWLTALLAIVLLVRQILEPKITGDTLGVSAFTMLAFMIISLSIFGVAGLIISPILIITLKALHEQGYLKRWIRLPEGEYDESP
ncbi:MAG: sporulation integral membrane protein YtvI [Gorillibacterium sp.]|nr:sporulation integral membrane protein YtvI [Gorillibacterium sp.]